MPTIRLEHVTKWYELEQKRRFRKESRREVSLSDINLKIEQGEFVFIVGSSGAGKSTLLKMLSGQEKPSEGEVYLDDRELSRIMRWSNNRVNLLFGHVMQETSLGRRMTVQENLQIAAQVGRKRLESKAQMQARIDKVLGLVGMANTGHFYPAELSQGENRRVELARALINSPPILVLDELTGNLDDDNIWDMLHLLTEVNRRGTTVIMATHASKYVNIMRRRVITLVDGRIYGDVEKGRYGDVV